MKRLLICLCALLLLLCTGCPRPSPVGPESEPAPSQPWPDLPQQRGRPGYYYREIFFEKVEDGVQTYQLHQPAEKEKGKRYPILIHLHCLGESEGTARYPITKVTGDYLIAPLIKLVNEQPEIFECYTVLPVDATSLNIRRIIERLVTYEQGDPDRVYLTGTSLGGFGTCDYMFTFPETLACAVPISGCTVGADAAPLVDLPVRIYHSADDPVVSVVTAQQLHQALKAAGSTKVEYFELRGYGHMAWNYAHKPELLEWMFKQNRKDR